MRWLTFGFGNAEDGVYDHSNASASEHKESAVGYLREHDGRELGVGLVVVLCLCCGVWLLVDDVYLSNDEIEEPLGH